ncbi:MAG: hypothetical protein REI09_11590 [Candidatus Dactylopiibacterium sp.]|nr:hypothetical protein [Candidatus Dactylopiibacterium sp.]
MKPWSSALLCLALASPVAFAAGAPERLVLEPYPGDTAWREVTRQQDGTQWLREQIPAGQEAGSHTDMLVAQAFLQQAGTDPSAFLKGMFAQVGAACTHAKANGPRARTEGGRAVAYAQIYCGRQNGTQTGAHIFIKVLQGEGALYVVQREFRVPPTETAGVTSFSEAQMAGMVALMQAQATANRYLLDAVYLCGGETPDPRCEAPRQP